MKHRTAIVAIPALLVAALAVAGPAAGPPAAAPAAGPATSATPPPAQGYRYEPQGRRDPFVSLVNRGTEVQTPSAARGPGVAGLTVDEVALRGIVHSRGAYVAMVQAPDGRSYIVRSGQRLYDGKVKAVTATAVVFDQQVNDPLSVITRREIRKPLRPTEEGK
jgi:type IV pilus assembly protein PilP